MPKPSSLALLLRQASVRTEYSELSWPGWPTTAAGALSNRPGCLEPASLCGGLQAHLASGVAGEGVPGLGHLLDRLLYLLYNL